MSYIVNVGEVKVQGTLGKVTLDFDSIYPSSTYYNQFGVGIGNVQHQLGNDGSTARLHTTNSFQLLAVNSEGYEVVQGAGSPVVKLNGTQVFP